MRGEGGAVSYRKEKEGKERINWERKGNGKGRKRLRKKIWKGEGKK